MDFNKEELSLILVSLKDSLLSNNELLLSATADKEELLANKEKLESLISKLEA